MKPHYIHTWAVRRAIVFCNERFRSQRAHGEKFVRNVYEFAKSDEFHRQNRRRHDK